MARTDERRKILDLLENGQITAEQAAVLLKALSPDAPPPPPPRPRPPTASAGRAVMAFSTSDGPHKGIARLLRISIDAVGEDGKNAKVKVNVPLALARFATKFMPEEARVQLSDQGIDLSELLDSLGDEVPEGRLVDIDAADEDGQTAKIIVEVV